MKQPAARPKVGINMISNDQSSPFQELAPIICEKCGSAIPLADTELTDCIYCHAPVEIPSHYRRGQLTRNRLSEIRQHASDFLVRLGSRPRFWEIWVSMLPSWAFFVMLIIFSMTGFMGTIIFLEVLASRLLGVNLTDYLPQLLVILLYAGLLFLFLSLAMAGFFLIRKRVFVTRRLMAILAAGEPVKPGGPATCRRCGGPFQTDENETVAACDYCGSENFLMVPQEWLSATRRLSTCSGRNIFWAEREFSREMASGNKSLINQLIIYGSFLLLVAGAFISGDPAKMKIWRNSVQITPRKIYGLAHDVAAPEIGKPFKLHGIFKKFRNEREFRYSIALKNKEHLLIAVEGTEPVKARIKGRYSSASQTISIGIPAEFIAQPGGWFDFYVTIKDTQPLPVIKVDLR